MTQTQDKPKFSDLIAPSFHGVMYDILDKKHVHYFLKGGRGSTKSSFVSLMLIVNIMLDKNANAVVLRKISHYLRGSVFEQIQWAIDVAGVSSVWSDKVSPMELTQIVTGQRIVFRGADDPKKVKSTAFSKGYCKYIWYEEFDEFTPEDIRSINQTLLRGGDEFNVFYSYNPPKSVQSWVNTEVLENRPDKLIHHSTYLTVPRNWLGEQFFIEAEHLKNTKPESYKHEYLGEVTGTGGEVFENIIIREITDKEIRSFDKICRGLDFGYAVDPLAYGEQYYDKTRKRLYIFFEIYKVNLKNSQAVRKIKVQNKNNGWITADSAEPRTINEFRELGLFNIKPAIKGPDSIEHGIKFLQDLEQIIIDPKRCPNATREFMNYALERDKNGNFKAKFPDKDNHMIDQCRYALEDEMRASSISFLK